MGGDSSDDAEKSTNLMRIVSRFCLTLRNVSTGDYRDEIASKTENRMQYLINEKMLELKSTLKSNVPNLDTPEYCDKIIEAMKEMRGRELPGFGSTRLLMSIVSKELDSWRMQVEDSVSDMIGIYLKTGSNIASKLSYQYPGLTNMIAQVVEDGCKMQTTQIMLKIEELFVRSVESATSDMYLIESINKIRYNKFETALKEVLTVAKETGKPEDNSKEDLKQHVMEMMGNLYMQHHAIGFGPTLQLEDGMAALKTYWKVCEMKLNEDVCAAVDLMLLQKCSEWIESELMTRVQLWLLNTETLRTIMDGDSSKRAVN